MIEFVIQTMQAQACHWIMGAFCTSPTGVVETLVGFPPIHLHICKLVERSHVCLQTLARRHSAQLLIWGDHLMSMVNLTLREKTLIHSSITEAWANNSHMDGIKLLVSGRMDGMGYNLMLIPMTFSAT